MEKENMFQHRFTSYIAGLFLLFCAYPSHAFEQKEFDKLYDSWMQEQKTAVDNAKTQTRTTLLQPKTESYCRMLEIGSPVLPCAVSKLKQNQGNLYLALIVRDIAKIRFEEILISDKRKMKLADYDYDYVAYPYFTDKSKFSSPYIYWWDTGRALTPEIFKRKYEAYIKAKSDGKEDEIKRSYTLLQNMGIVILPNLLEKIESGEKDLIPMFSYLTDGKVKENATPEDCKKYWDKNKDDYAQLLDFPKNAKK